MKRMLKIFAAILSVSLVFASCSKEDDEKSSEKQLKQFGFLDVLTSVRIDENTKTVTVIVGNDINVTELTPIMEVSAKATVNPLSGIPQDFTKPVVFTVIAEDGSTTAYVVTVTVEGNGNGGNGGDVTNITDAISLSGTMNENKTLKDLGLPIDYIIDGSLYIDGNACLTIEPGVTIAFTGESGYVEVGENAGLKMVGTAEKPIVFQGPVNNVNKGSWGYIQYKSNRSDNQMEYVIMKNGGSNEYAVLTTYSEGSVSVKNCTIDGGLGNGFETIYNNGKNLKAFENNTIKNVNGYPISIGTLVANGLGSGNKFETNGNNFIQLTGHLSDKEELTLNKQEIPYLIDGIQLNGRCEMTVNAGVTIAFEKNSEMFVYEEAIIKLEGTESEPVVLCGRESKAGYWEGVNYGSKDDESIFKNVVISDGNEYCLRLDYYNEEVLKAENLTLKNAKEYGVIVSTGTNEEEVEGETVYSRDWSKAFEGGVTGLKFENCAKGNIYDNNLLDGETDGTDNVFEAIP